MTGTLAGASAQGEDSHIDGGVLFVCLVCGVGLPLLSYHLVERPVREWRSRTHLKPLGAMILLIGCVELWLGLLRGPLLGSLSVAQPLREETPSCPEASVSSSYAALLSAEGVHGNTNVSTAFGWSAPSGACRYCDDLVPSHVAPRVAPLGNASSGSTAAPLCLPNHGDPMADDAFCSGMGESEPRCNVGVSVAGLDSSAIAEAFAPDRERAPELPTRTVFLLGDSHAGALLPGLLAAVRGRAQVRTFVQPGCGFTWSRQNSLAPTWAGEPTASMCSQLFSLLVSQLREHVRSGDVVAIHHYQIPVDWRPGSVSDYVDVRDASGNAITASQFYDVYLHTIFEQILQPRNASLLFFGDWPTSSAFPKTPKTCARSMLSTFLNGEGDRSRCSLTCARPFGREDHPLPRETMRSLASNYAGVHYLDLMPFYAEAMTDTSITFSPLIPGTNIVAFSDTHHLNILGSLYLWPFISDFLTRERVLV